MTADCIPDTSALFKDNTTKRIENYSVAKNLYREPEI